LNPIILFVKLSFQMRAARLFSLLLFSLASFSAEAFPQTSSQIDIFAKAYSLYSGGNFVQARDLFQKTIDSKFVLADYSLYYLGTIAANDKDSIRARQLLTELKQRYPQSIWAYPADLQRAKLDIGEQKFAQAAEILRTLRAQKGLPAAISQEALFLSAQAAQDDPVQAFNAYQELRNSYPTSRWTPQARKEQARIREQLPQLAPLNTVDALLDEADRLSRERAVDDAEAMYRKALNSSTEADQRFRCLTKLASLLTSARKRNEALPVLEQIARDYSETPDAGQALYQIGQIYWNRHENLRALEYFRQVIDRYPISAYIDKAQYAAGDIYEWQGKQDDAITLYSQVATLFPNSEVRDDANWRLAWLYYRIGALPEALSSFKSLANQARDSGRRVASLYWEGRVAERIGDTELARQIYQQVYNSGDESYYQTLAANSLSRLGITVQERKSNQTSIAPDPTSKLGPKVEFHLARARQLSQIALQQMAVTELDQINRLNNKTSGLRALLMREYFKNQAYGRSLALADQLSSSFEDRNIYRFPLGYWELIQQKARSRDLDPYLVLSVIRQESLFDTRARSPAAAYGLMQLLPSTAARMAKQVGLPPPANEELYDPDTNLTLGVQYLRELLQRYSNNWFKAIAAYNAGEGAVDRWEKEIVTNDIEEFVERIPYIETRGYVKLVMRNHRVYKRLYDFAK
jgi:soluble lytic murein transglycosylase